MSFFDFINKVQSFCEKGLENHTIIFIAGVVFICIFIIGMFFVFALYKGSPTEYQSESYKTIIANAPKYCNDRNFSSFKFVGKDSNSNAEVKLMENLTFVCFHAENNTIPIEKLNVN